MDDEERDRKILQWQKKARMASRKKQGRQLYVITLDPEVLWLREFRQENPGYIEGMPCVYVGMTIHDPGDRFEQHKAGYRSSRYPRKYGVELALELIEGFAGEGLADNEKEAALADWLRDQGCAVWQN
jgi:predicted GIY-YIG superfamily endonuclease